MSQERFAMLMAEFTSGLGIDWQGRESHNRARFRFGETEIEFRYSAGRHALFLKAKLWKIEPQKNYALCLSLLNINSESRYMAAMSEDGQLFLRARLLVEQMRGNELEEQVKAFVSEVSHLQRIFGNSEIAEFLSDGSEAESEHKQPDPSSFISP